MSLTELETALGNAYPQDLEKLAADLLAERGYDVAPTGTKGTDDGIDAVLHDDDRDGILHVSRTRSDRLRGKLTDDAAKAAGHDQDYDFFVFVNAR
ncbi:restriction endonuclease [Halorussus gelatinilyticus]|uniref:Restriction endonuclease n=1 Tax=Halorussus gelatinilyticus TaxID=2937524 RepID=A0A8U0IJ08_9EURY|nr:restriction endonuclease [Halorussus gelatinilyticus]UPW01087.1 restriction endonuclease [Halorussus gelatinilyticus]